MKKTSGLILIFIVLLVVAAAMYYMYKQSQLNGRSNESTFVGPDNSTFTGGIYVYRCADNSKFNMLLAADMQTVRLLPGEGAIFSKVDLKSMRADSGVKYEGGSTSFTASGETVMLSFNGSTQQCDPVNAPGQAPFNFGN